MDIINFGNGDIKRNCLISFSLSPEHFICLLSCLPAGYITYLTASIKTDLQAQKWCLVGWGRRSKLHPPSKFKTFSKNDFNLNTIFTGEIGKMFKRFI